MSTNSCLEWLPTPNPDRRNSSLKSSMHTQAHTRAHIPVQGNRNKAVNRGRHGNALYISDGFAHEPSQEPCWNTSRRFSVWRRAMKQVRERQVYFSCLKALSSRCNHESIFHFKRLPSCCNHKSIFHFQTASLCCNHESIFHCKTPSTLVPPLRFQCARASDITTAERLIRLIRDRRIVIIGSF